MEQKLLTYPEHLNSSQICCGVAQSLVFCAVFVLYYNLFSIFKLILFNLVVKTLIQNFWNANLPLLPWYTLPSLDILGVEVNV
jgi:hypothetical protein